MNFLETIKQKAKQANKIIALPEGEDERVLIAANEIVEQGIAQIILFGNKREILAKAEKLGLRNIGQIRVIEPALYEKRDEIANIMVEMRKSKGLTRNQALEELDRKSVV